MRQRLHRALPLLTVRSATSVLLAALIITSVSPAAGQPEFRHARGVIHLDSTVSGGDFSPEEMVRFLQENGIQIAVFTDHDTVKWDYGFFPAPWLIGRMTGWVIGKAFGRTGSVQSYGSVNYVSELDALDETYEEVLVIPGVEAIPFFYWEGSLLFNTLSIHNAYKHLLAFGMDDPSDYESIPSVGNGFFRGFGLSSLLSLWPVAMLFVAFKIQRRSRDSEFGGALRVFSIGLTGLGLLFLLYNFPYAFGRYDQYHGDQGTEPYQEFIDYVTDRGGLVFWAHPEIEVDRVIKKPPLEVKMKTDAYYQDLLYTGDYTGFAAFYEGMKYTIPPGGIWDRVLEQYATGRREAPVWAIAEGDIEGEHFSPKLSQTVFLLREFTRSDALNALREGRVYAMAGPVSEHLRLESFTVTSGVASAYAGQSLAADGSVKVRAVVQCEDSFLGNDLKAELIRNGSVVRTEKAVGELVLEFEDDPPSGRMNIYRLDVRAPKQTRLLSNPIFVKAATSS